MKYPDLRAERILFLLEEGVLDEDRRLLDAFLDRGDAVFTFLAAGLSREHQPFWTWGWRLGTLPASGRSWNYRDKQWEPGVSMMRVEGAYTPFPVIFAAFNAAGRSRIYAAGWLVMHRRGSDGEPLLAEPVRCTMRIRP